MKFTNGRFRQGLDPAALRFSSSLLVDRTLFREDIAGSIAHAQMLAQTKILTHVEVRKICKGLREIHREIEDGKLSLDIPGAQAHRFVAEDIHMAIEKRLIEKIGDIGRKLHTARSRNDQVALDERLYLRSAIGRLATALRSLQGSLVRKAAAYRDVVMYGYTHLQRAQPILLAHHLLAYVAMFERDSERYADCLKRTNRSPLGAVALAGTSFPIDRRAAARKLGMDGIIENSIDAVSDRDVQLEFLSASAITMMHLSRIAEDLVLWSSQEWGFAEIGESFATGSSIMPQKKNPDMAELVRGKTGRVYGDLIALLTVMKGLPLSYNRDMQEDKEPLFDAAATVEECLLILSRMFDVVTFHRERFTDETDAGFSLATDLADYLVRNGESFRTAHDVVGRIVQNCISTHRSLAGLSPQDYQKFSPAFSADLFTLLDVRSSLAAKQSEGSTSPGEIGRSLRYWKRKLRRR